MQPRKVKLINYLAYGSNDLFGAGATAIMALWAIPFYTTFCGLTATQAASIFAIARILDAFFSPLIGHLSDHLYNTRLGRKFGRRRFFVLAAIPLLPSFAIMWISGQNYWFYLVTYVLFELVYAMELIPYETLAAEMTKDYKIKAKFAGCRILFAQCSAILAGFVPAMIIKTLGEDDPATFLYLASGAAVLFMATAAFVYLFTWERPPSETGIPVTTEKLSFTTGVKALFGNLSSTLKVRAFRQHIGMYLGGYISQDLFNGVFIFFIAFALGGTKAMGSGLWGYTAVAQLISVAVFIPVIIRYHPAPSYRVAVGFFAAAVLGFLGLYLGQPANMFASVHLGGATWGFDLPPVWLLLPVLLAGLGRGALNYIPWNVYNYMADVDEAVTGKRREGAFAGVMTFIRKTLQAIVIAAIGPILDMNGFAPTAHTQSPHTVHVIVAILVGGTLVLLAIGFIVSLRFKLNSDTHAVLMEEIERFKTDPNPTTTPERKAILENLTGWSYDRLWGRDPLAAKVGPAPPPAAPESY
jgi:oligogalacturonide transporter